MNGLTFDAGGLIALERNDRRVLLVLHAALVEGSNHYSATRRLRVMVMSLLL